MLATRVLTAAVLIPLTLAALFLLPPRAFGVVLLAVVLAAGRLDSLRPATSRTPGPVTTPGPLVPTLSRQDQ